MNQRSALKKAADIYAYIEKESGYAGASRNIRRIVMRKIAVTIMANGEVQQGFIESLVRVFACARREKRRAAALAGDHAALN